MLIDHGKSVWMEEKDFYQDIVIATSGSFAYKRKVSLSYHVKKDKHFYSKPSTQAKKQSSDARFVIDIDELFQLKKKRYASRVILYRVPYYMVFSDK